MRESSVQRDPLFDVMPEDKIDHMETENAQSEGRTREMVDEDKEFDEVRLSTEDVVSTDKEGVSTDFEKVYRTRPINFNGGTVAFGVVKAILLVKLPDENQILLKVPRQNNMYSFNLENIVPSGGLACLIAKATTDESNKWHRRLGHVNFKNLNRLVRGNLFRGIKREYSNARTPQQNGVAKRKNMTLIEAARTMLADSFLPNTKFFFGLKQFVVLLLYHLGKFVGKSDEGFLVGYSLQSKAFRVYNLVTKRVEENLHINFLENKPNVAGKGPNWLFDLDYLTDSMNYHYVRSENQANIHAGQQESNQNTGTKDKNDAGDSEKEDESAQDCFELPIWHSYSSTNPFAPKTDNKRGGSREEEQVFLDDLARLQRQEKEANEEAEALRKTLEQETENLVTQGGAAKSSGTNIFSTVSTTAKASGTNFVNTVSIPVSTASANEGLSLSETTNSQEDDNEIPPLEDIHEDTTDGIFTHSSYDDEGDPTSAVKQEAIVIKVLTLMPVVVIRLEALEDESWVDDIDGKKKLLQSVDFASVKIAAHLIETQKALVNDEESQCCCWSHSLLVNDWLLKSNLDRKCTKEVVILGRRLITWPMQKATIVAHRANMLLLQAAVGSFMVSIHNVRHMGSTS
ncbi:ribonuclease H-like domain-containing protein [Tanacetum coccineum]